MGNSCSSRFSFEQDLRRRRLRKLFHELPEIAIATKSDLDLEMGDKDTVLDLDCNSTWEIAVDIIKIHCLVASLAAVVAVGAITRRSESSEVRNNDIYNLWETSVEGREILEAQFVSLANKDDTIHIEDARNILITIFDIDDMVDNFCDAFTEGRGIDGASLSRISYPEIVLIYSVLCFKRATGSRRMSKLRRGSRPSGGSPHRRHSVTVEASSSVSTTNLFQPPRPDGDLTKLQRALDNVDS